MTARIGVKVEAQTIEPFLSELAPIPAVTLVHGIGRGLMRLDSGEALAALERMVQRTELDGECWAWRGYRRSGYGCISIRNADVYLHVLSQAMTGEARPPGHVVVRHRCDNPPCWRQAHLLTGTHQENVADARERGRAVPPPRIMGLGQHLARLTDGEVSEIRVLISRGAKQRDVAEAFDCSQSTVWRIAHRKVRA